jgi:hypothetical protein
LFAALRGVAASTGTHIIGWFVIFGCCGLLTAEGGGGFADGFGVGRGFGAVAEEVGEAGCSEGLGFVLEESAAGFVGADEAGAGIVELGGGEEVVELVEGEVVELAELGGGDGGVEEVFDEGGEGGGRGIGDQGLGIRRDPLRRLCRHLPRRDGGGEGRGSGWHGLLRRRRTTRVLGMTWGFVMLYADGRLGARVVLRSNPWHPEGDPLRHAGA